MDGVNVTNGTVKIANGGLACNCDPDRKARFRFPITGGVDATQSLFVADIFSTSNVLEKSGLIRLFDSSGNLASIVTIKSWRRGQILYKFHLPSQPGFSVEPEFDYTSVTTFEFQLNFSGSDRPDDTWVIRQLFYYDLSAIVLTGGTASDPITPTSILESFNRDVWSFDFRTEGSLFLKEYPKQAASLLEVDAPLAIGDGVPGSTTFKFDEIKGFSYLIRQKIFELYDSFQFEWTELSNDLPSFARRLIINLGDAATYAAFYLYLLEFRDISPAEITYRSGTFLRCQLDFSTNSVISGCTLLESTATTIGGKLYANTSFVDYQALIVLEISGPVVLDECIFDAPQADYYLSFTSSIADEFILDVSTVNILSPPAQSVALLNAPDKKLVLIVGDSGITEFDVEIVAGTLEIVAPQKTIRFFGIPDVPGAILWVVDTSTGVGVYPTLVGGEATLVVDESRTYRVRADAPGYLSSRFSTILGSTPEFEFSLEDYRALYDSGVNKSSQIVLDLQTYEVTITDDGDLTFADVFHTLEDYLSTEQGVMLPYPPVPVVVDLGIGLRNYLFFPYDPVLGQVNPVRIKPSSTNTSDPELLDFVIVLVGAEAPLFDIFDFTDGGGRSIRFQTDAVAASIAVSSGGAFNPEQEQQLANLHATLESPGVFSGPALANVPATASNARRFDIRLIARQEEGVGTPSEILYRELVFCPDAFGGEGQVYIGQRDGTPIAFVTVQEG
ncbi:MAG: hypothetical protein AAF766_22810 [Cyanobacteria bacterium P01_D01_bin.14]